ncbi:CLOCK-interacting pacemaker-like isoform X2 [Scophthalmus maximus]|uniref:CLOCK-interacting pacemaker-like isoform X2 n=1 Tax=Scophthalmus maximus TaxID=52904 RepID=UPI001FA841F0|nr:CLOCK-interacting pacemaker-like isoform X2 [Scophthalmus maximus]
MAKEQSCSHRDGARAASSKNAKDESNSTTLLAMRDAKDADESSGSSSRYSSEKDSGFSDGSDWQQTDVDDQHSDKGRTKDGERADASQPDQNREREQGSPGNLTPMPEGRKQFSIFKNMVLTQPDTVQKEVHLLWTNRSSATRQVILCQQPVVLPTAAPQLHAPVSRRSVVMGKKINSYPRIAPHPNRKPPDKPSSSDDPQDLRRSESSPGTGGLPERHQGDTVSSSSSAAASSSHASSSASRGRHRSGVASARHRRFLNMVKVLRQSGLLHITLRTKELQRQSDAVGQDVAQLRRHVELLCEAACRPPDGAAALERLHRAMAESRSYPDLNLIPPHPESSSGRPQSIASGDEDAAAPPSRLVTIVLNPNCPTWQQARSERSRELNAFMSPDSSTG